MGKDPPTTTSSLSSISEHRMQSVNGSIYASMRSGSADPTMRPATYNSSETVVTLVGVPYTSDMSTTTSSAAETTFSDLQTTTSFYATAAAAAADPASTYASSQPHTSAFHPENTPAGFTASATKNASTNIALPWSIAGVAAAGLAVAVATLVAVVYTVRSKSRNRSRRAPRDDEDNRTLPNSSLSPSLSRVAKAYAVRARQEASRKNTATANSSFATSASASTNATRVAPMQPLPLYPTPQQFSQGQQTLMQPLFLPAGPRLMQPFLPPIQTLPPMTLPAMQPQALMPPPAAASVSRNAELNAAAASGMYAVSMSDPRARPPLPPHAGIMTTQPMNASGANGQPEKIQDKNDQIFLFRPGPLPPRTNSRPPNADQRITNLVGWPNGNHAGVPILQAPPPPHKKRSQIIKNNQIADSTMERRMKNVFGHQSDTDDSDQKSPISPQVANGPQFVPKVIFNEPVRNEYSVPDASANGSSRIASAVMNSNSVESEVSGYGISVMHSICDEPFARTKSVHVLIEQPQTDSHQSTAESPSVVPASSRSLSATQTPTDKVVVVMSPPASHASEMKRSAGGVSPMPSPTPQNYSIMRTLTHSAIYSTINFDMSSSSMINTSGMHEHDNDAWAYSVADPAANGHANQSTNAIDPASATILHSLMLESS